MTNCRRGQYVIYDLYIRKKKFFLDNVQEISESIYYIDDTYHNMYLSRYIYLLYIIQEKFILAKQSVPEM